MKYNKNITDHEKIPGERCSVCKGVVYATLHGSVCGEGHGGAPTESVENNQKYYIYSHKHTSDSHHTVRIFWQKEQNGYTYDLDNAGIYTEEDYQSDKEKYPCVTTIARMMDFIEKGHNSFYIPVDKVSFLGKKMTCVLN